MVSGDVPDRTYHVISLVQPLVVLAQGNHEDQGANVVKTMDPFLPLASLTTDVKYAVSELSHSETGLDNASGFNSGAQNILIGGDVTLCRHALQRVEEAARQPLINKL